MSAMQYQNLDELLRQEPEAGNYFFQLPEYVRSQIRTRGDSVNSFEHLRDYAENLTRGDD